MSARNETFSGTESVVWTGFGIVAIVAFFFLIGQILIRFIVFGTQPLAGVFLIALLVFAALSLGYVFWRESLKEKRERIARAPGLDSVPPANTARELVSPYFEPVPSVVEDTTDLLPTRRDTKRLDNE